MSHYTMIAISIWKSLSFRRCSLACFIIFSDLKAADLDQLESPNFLCLGYARGQLQLMLTANVLADDPLTEPSQLDDSSTMVGFHLVRSFPFLPDGKLGPSTDRVLLVEPKRPNYTKNNIGYGFIYPNHYTFHLITPEKSCFITYGMDTPDVDIFHPWKIHKVPLPPATREMRHFIHVRDSATEVFVHSVSEAFLIDFITGEITAKWAGVQQLDCNDHETYFWKKTGTLTRLADSNGVHYINQTYLHENSRVRDVTIAKEVSHRPFVFFVHSQEQHPEFILAQNDETDVRYGRMKADGSIEKQHIVNLPSELEENITKLNPNYRIKSDLYLLQEANRSIKVISIKLPNLGK